MKIFLNSKTLGFIIYIFLNINIFCIVLFSVTSCSNKILFTQAYRNRVTSKKQLNVERLQYYNDRNIELVYRSSSAHESISGGKVEFKNGYYIYTIEIKKNTPCVVKWYNNNNKILNKHDCKIIIHIRLK